MKLFSPLRSLGGGAAAAAALALAACGPGTDEPPAETTPDTADESAATGLPLPEGDVVAAAFEGHLEQLQNGQVEPFSLGGSKPEYYLLYYTASW